MSINDKTLDEPQRRPGPNVDIAADLVVDMREIFRSAAPLELTEVAAARERYADALSVVAVLMRKIGAGNDIVEQFMALAGAVKDLQSGTVHPMFRPNRTGGRTIDRSDVRFGREHAAIALCCLLRAGDSREK